SAKHSIILHRTVPRPAPDPPSAVPRLPGTAVYLITFWEDERDDAAELFWVEKTMQTFTSAGVASPAANAMNHNYALPTEDRVKSLYGPEAYPRLAQIKAIYDPDNVFRRNYNIPPTRQSGAEA